MIVALAMGAFVLSHVVIARSGLKAWLLRRFGQSAYLLGYSLLSVLLLSSVIAALRASERITLWTAPVWSFPFAALATLAGFILLMIGSLTPNPLSVSFLKTGYVPQRPGFVGWVRHPIIWGLSLWGLAHIPANGDWPSLVLFAGSAGFGLLGVWAVERRLKRSLGAKDWQRLQPGAGHMDRRAWIGLVSGIALWLILLAVHPHLFGADPLAVLLALVAG